MLGARIAALRRSRGMNQRQLAAQLRISPSAVGMYEQGRREPPGRLLVEMAQVFGVSTDYLLTGEAVQACDFAQLGALTRKAQSELDGQLLLRRSDGTARPVTDEDLALLLAALLG